MGWGILGDIAGKIKDTAEVVVDGVVDGASNTINSTVDVVEDLADGKILDAASDALDGFNQGTDNAINTITDLSDEIVPGSGQIEKDGIEKIDELASGDLQFPDNPNRVRRFDELNSDISGFDSHIINARQRLSEALVDVNQSIVDVFKKTTGKEVLPEYVAPINMEFHKDEYQLSKLLAPLAVWELATSTRFLGKASLDSGPALVVVLGSLAILGTIAGAEKRHQYREGIRKASDMRQKIVVGTHYLEQLAEHLAGLSTAIRKLGEHQPPHDEKLLTTLITNMIEQLEKEIPDPTSKCVEELEALDKRRNSWCKEDH